MREERQITDDMLLSELTVGEFKKLVQDLLGKEKPSKIEPPIEKVNIRRKSLDEFMDDLGGKK
jgi:hypothetical protein